jgi:hypothetical protein
MYFRLRRRGNFGRSEMARLKFIARANHAEPVRLSVDANLKVYSMCWCD